MNATLQYRSQCPSDQEAARDCDAAPSKEAALTQFGLHADRLSAIIRRVLARRLRGMIDPEDLLQELAVVLLSKPLPDRLDNSAELTRYLVGIAKNLALAQNRKYLDGRHHTRLREVPLGSVCETELPAAREPEACDRAQQRESLADLQNWLPLRVREIVTWICAGYSVAEVAASFDVDERTVILFVCAANNFGRHRERQISLDDAMCLFKRRRRRRREIMAATG